MHFAGLLCSFPSYILYVFHVNMCTYLSWYQAAVLQDNEPHPYLDIGWFPISRLVRFQNASFSTVVA